jgi:hypothetical protein
MKRLAVVILIIGFALVAPKAEAQSIIHTITKIRRDTQPTTSQCKADLAAWDNEMDKWMAQYAKDKDVPLAEEKMTTEELYHRLYKATSCLTSYKGAKAVTAHIGEVKSFEDHVVNAQAELLSRAVSIMDDHHLSEKFFQYERQ